MSEQTFIAEPSDKPRGVGLKKLLGVGFAIFILIAVFLGFSFVTLSSATDLPESPLVFEIERGMSVRSIAHEAKQAGLVHSELMLYSIITALYDPTNIHAGQYVFTEPMSVFKVAEKIASSDVNDTLVTLTIPEGIRAEKIADIAGKQLTEFNVDDYLAQAIDKEGYLYPETYFVPESFTATELLNLQEQTYEENIAPLRPSIASSTFTEYEVLILASIIEREANDEASMKMVSGILQNRLAIGMALQADATIEYVLEDPLHELDATELAENLRTVDSPYNTYLYPGLPPTPINNPGLMAITAVLEPTPSDYFYYITDADGEFHYAKTLNQHNQNVADYLR